MTALITAGAGFLLAVLWFDLIFDTQVRGHAADGDLPEETLASIAGYYRRASTEARPMDLLVVAAMATTLAALIAQVARGDVATWVAVAALTSAAIAVGIAGVRTVPSARRLGTRQDPVAVQSRLARAIYRDHIVCFVLVASVLALELGPA
ncbi:MAG: hypothetical protein ACHQJ5_01610 [Vicinamibacteria bacterium]|jgi:hypothetical protein